MVYEMGVSIGTTMLKWQSVGRVIPTTRLPIVRRILLDILHLFCPATQFLMVANVFQTMTRVSTTHLI